MKAGVAVNPHTPVSALSDILHDINLVCLMSVNPGFGGQKFIPYTLDKIKQLRKMIDDSGLKVHIEIDGGVTLENAPSIIAAGADVLVAGNTVFKLLCIIIFCNASGFYICVSFGNQCSQAFNFFIVLIVF